MKKYIIQRIVVAILTILLVTTICFILLHLIPGSPFQSTKLISKDMELRMLEYYGLDKPLINQYFIYLKNVLTFNFGYSYKTMGLSVNSIIAKTFPVSAIVGVTAFIISYPIGIALGSISAHKKGKIIDKICVTLSALFSAMPLFVIATIIQYMLSVKLNLFPSGLWKGIQYMILPTLSLTLMLIFSKIRQVRSLVLEINKSDYMLYAKSKGLPKLYVWYNYEFKNVLVPMISTLGNELASALMGSIVIEQIFSLPGIGRYYIMAIQNLDYSVVLGITIFYTIMVVFLNLIVDLLYGYIDPRIRFQNKGGNL